MFWIKVRAAKPEINLQNIKTTGDVRSIIYVPKPEQIGREIHVAFERIPDFFDAVRATENVLYHPIFQTKY